MRGTSGDEARENSRAAAAAEGMRSEATEGSRAEHLL